MTPLTFLTVLIVILNATSLGITQSGGSGGIKIVM